MLIVAIAFGTFCATLAGGLFALRLSDRLHLVLGFSAGAVVAVAFFDLIPEAIVLGESFYTSTTVVSWVAVGFLSYLVLDRVQMLRSPGGDHQEGADRPIGRRGAIGAASLSVHSFLDGIAIGVALQASTEVGAVVTIAVLAHDLSDGINTTNVVVKNGGTQRQALRWLLADALAPAVGIGSTLLIRIPNAVLGILLALFAGLFLYLGASDLIPESHHAHPKLLTTGMTLLGAAAIYGAVTLAGR
jgi:ZIP family zinc transporter